MRPTFEHKQTEQQEVVSGQNAQGAPRVEAAVVVRTTSGIEQDSRNQKSGEDEEEIYADPAWPR